MAINFNNLQKGSGGTDVRRLQETLNSKGYNLTVDGMFDDKTLAAVKDYQKKNGLAVDGIVGTKTWASLKGNTTPSGATGGGATSGSSSSSSNKNTFSSGFKNNPYVESDTVKAAQNALNAQLAKNPGEYKGSPWQTQLDDTIKAILNREKFNYDFNGDALYQQYKDKFINQGKMAMQDTMGQVSAMTGGYGNSYAATVGNQAYQAHLNELNDVIPELYQMAYDRYAQEGQDLLNQYSLLADRENQNYSRYQDDYNKFLAERDYLTDRLDAEKNFDYGKYMDDQELKYGDYIWQKEFDEAKAQWDAKYNPTTDDDTPNDDNNDDTYDPAVSTNLSDFSREEYMKNVKANGGSFYGSTLADLREMKSKGYSNKEVQTYLAELVASSYLTGSEYSTLYSKYRNNKL